MKRILAGNLSYRVIAVLCFALGVAGYTAFTRLIDPLPTRFLVRPTDVPEPLGGDRDLLQYTFGGRFDDCYFEYESWQTAREFRLARKRCSAQREEIRRFILDAWNDKYLAYAADGQNSVAIFIDYVQPSGWQITLRKNPFARCRCFPQFGARVNETLAVDVIRRSATEDTLGYERGQSIVVFLDKNGEQIFAL